MIIHAEWRSLRKLGLRRTANVTADKRIFSEKQLNTRLHTAAGPAGMWRKDARHSTIDDSEKLDTIKGKS